MTAKILSNQVGQLRIECSWFNFLTAMEERKKFTYRYDDNTEKLLNEGLTKFKISSLNKLIDKLIYDALVQNPIELNALKTQIQELQNKLNICQAQKGQVDKQFAQLKSAVKQDFENRERIKELIS